MAQLQASSRALSAALDATDGCPETAAAAATAVAICACAASSAAQMRAAVAATAVGCIAASVNRLQVQLHHLITWSDTSVLYCQMDTIAAFVDHYATKHQAHASPLSCCCIVVGVPLVYTILCSFETRAISWHDVIFAHPYRHLALRSWHR